LEKSGSRFGMTSIVIAGYTAAGKTTHSRLLAEFLGYGHVWAAGLLLDRLGYEDVAQNESGLWFHRSDEIERRRAGGDADAWVDGELRRLAKGRDAVIDSRFLPWLPKVGTVNVWLESDLRSRALKCWGSVRAIDPNITITQCAVHVHNKDGRDVERVAAAYGGVFASDPALHHLIVDVSVFLPVRGTIQLDADPIEHAQRYIRAAVAWRLGELGPVAQLVASDPDKALSVYHKMPAIWRDLELAGALDLRAIGRL